MPSNGVTALHACRCSGRPCAKSGLTTTQDPVVPMTHDASVDGRDLIARQTQQGYKPGVAGQVQRADGDESAPLFDERQRPITHQEVALIEALLEVIDEAPSDLLVFAQGKHQRPYVAETALEIEAHQGLLVVLRLSVHGEDRFELHELQL